MKGFQPTSFIASRTVFITHRGVVEGELFLKLESIPHMFSVGGDGGVQGIVTLLIAIVLVEVDLSRRFC
jgi:hypothetical protein